ncbi:IclR family transcriptional regulator [Leucobacter iarius]|uniref:IclR family transcriptional regulator n=1 Tax=Leucobacter iarius TaxID=333963 RepID=A0ABN2L7A1_9MICO
MTASDSGAPAQRNNSASLRKALSILLHIGGETDGDGFTLTRLSEELGINKSTVVRLLQPLLETHFVEQNESTGVYQLGWQNAQLGQAYLAGVRVDLDMHQILVELTRRSGETSHLVRAASPSVVYIDKVDSPHAVRMVSRVGNSQPMYSTSVGKCILAHADESTLQAVLAAGMPRRTPTTITTEAGMRAELQRIREQGWAIDDVENEDGIRCVAAPVFDADGRCQHAISASGPVSRVPRDRVPQLVPLVTGAAAEISRRMGAPSTAAGGPV